MSQYDFLYIVLCTQVMRDRGERIGAAESASRFFGDRNRNGLEVTSILQPQGWFAARVGPHITVRVVGRSVMKSMDQ